MDRMNKIGKAQKSHIYRSCNRFSKQETKIEQLEQDLKDTVDSKLEEALGNIFKNDKKIESEVQNVVKILRKSKDFNYHLGSVIVGSENVYPKIT